MATTHRKMNFISKIYFWWYIRLKYGFHRKPLYLINLLRNYIKAYYYHLTGMKKFILRGVDFAVTYRCNFNCEHCYAVKLLDNNREEMTIDDYKRVCKQAMEMGCICFSLQGGEVFMRKDWEEVIKAFRPHKNHILITTNGSFITDECVIRLKELGVDTLFFSIDSGIGEEHDRFRRHPGNFDEIMRAVEYCKKHKIKVFLNTCVLKQSLYTEGFRRLLDYSHKKRVLINTIFARSLGNYGGRTEVMLDKEDKKYYYRLRKNYPFAVRDLDHNYGKWGCPAVKEVLYITAYGDVCPCPFTHISLGNIKDENLKDIRDRGLSSKWWNKYFCGCSTASNEEFIDLYYPLVEKKPLITLKELNLGSGSTRHS